MPAGDVSEFDRILDGCIAENRVHQNALYRIYYPYGMSIAIRYVDSEQEAISVLNDAFLKAFTNIKRFDRQKSFKPWFRRIVINAAINFLRQQKRFSREAGYDDSLIHPTTENILSRIHYKELIAMVQSLSSSYRTVFNLYVIDGFKHKEIAEKMGISEGTSKSNLTRAKAKLKEMIAKELNTRHV